MERLVVAKPRSDVMIVAVSTSMQQYKAMYSQARELADYALRKVEFSKVATLRCSAFPPEVIVSEDGLVSLPECHFYKMKEKPGLLLFAGDTSPMDDQQEFADVVLDYAQEAGVKELYSLGARWAENPLPPEQDPEPVGFATDKVGTAKLKKKGVGIIPEEPAPFFSSVIVGLAPEHGIRGFKLAVDHGEPAPHPRSVRKLLDALGALTGMEVPTDGLAIPSPAHPVQPAVGSAGIYH